MYLCLYIVSSKVDVDMNFVLLHIAIIQYIKCDGTGNIGIPTLSKVLVDMKVVLFVSFGPDTPV